MLDTDKLISVGKCLLIIAAWFFLFFVFMWFVPVIILNASSSNFIELLKPVGVSLYGILFFHSCYFVFKLILMHKETDKEDIKTKAKKLLANFFIFLEWIIFGVLIGGLFVPSTIGSLCLKYLILMGITSVAAFFTWEFTVYKH